MDSFRGNNQLPNLEKLFKDEDDQDFAPLAGSNLAAIFGTPQKLSDSPVSVKQSSHKKPSSGRNTPQSAVASANKTEVIIARVVHAYKLQNGQYILIGKLGIALTGNAAGRVYQIILYRGKQEHISLVTLTPNFSYTIRENNYATYYDGNNENWSLRFDDETSCIEFAREVGVARFHSIQTKPDNSVFYQNLSVESETQGAKESDEVQLKSVIHTNLNQPLKLDGASTQSMIAQISQYDNWERSLLNCNKGLKRLLILPPSKQISLGPGFPKEREIIMEIEIVDIVRNEEKKSSAPKPPVSSGKAAILSRMAKMGQSMLPKVPTSTTTDSEDTEEEIHVKSPRRFKPEVSSAHSVKHSSRLPQEPSQEPAPIANVIVPRPVLPSSVPLSNRPMMPSPALTSPWQIAPIQPQYVTVDGQFYPVHQTPIAQSIPVGMDPNLNVFLSETRTQNTEIRMGMSKIADNVQKLLDKFHVLEVQSASSPIGLQRAVHRSLDDSLFNEERFAGEEKATGKGKKSTEIPYSGNIQKEQKLEIELGVARGTLEEQAVKLKKFDTEKQEWSIEKMQLEAKMEQLEKQLADVKKTLESANETVGQLKQKNHDLESSISTLNAEKFASEKSEHERNQSVNQKAAEIKRLMNNTYRTLLSQFADEETYAAEDIKETLADTIRSITFSVLSDLQHGETEESSEIMSSSGSVEERGGSTDANTIKNRPTTIPVAQEEPPPVPPMDDDVATQDDFSK